MRYLTIIFCLALLIFSLNQAQAKIIHVPADSSTIQGGINGAIDGDTVLVEEGHYYERINFGGKVILVTSEFMNDGDTLHIQNTIIDADTSILGVSDRGSVICFLNGEDSTSIIQGFTLQNGIGTSPAGIRFGGGIYCSRSSPNVLSCNLVGNTAHWGGGMYCYHSSPVLLNCTFSGNFDDGFGSGGGMYCKDGSHPTLMNCTFSGNSCPDGIGGGLNCEYGTHPTLTNCTFVGNCGYWGGGMGCIGSSPAVTNCTFSENSAYVGGGMHCRYGSFPILTNCTFNENSVFFYGGGMYCSTSPASLINCTFSGNFANHYGGGMECYYCSPTLTNCTFSGNSVGYYDGGGMACADSSFPTLENCIIAFSTRGKAVHCLDEYSSPTFACSDIYGNAGGDWIGCIANQAGTNGNISECPLFCDLSENEFYVSSSSPCAPGNNECGVLMGAWGVGCSILCGDASGDGVINSADVVYLINYLFKGGPAPEPLQAGDVNCDGIINSADVVYLINYLFKGGPPPCD